VPEEVAKVTADGVVLTVVEERDDDDEDDANEDEVSDDDMIDDIEDEMVAGTL